jgi:molybdenum cofactor cytidylyltransferase
MTLRFAAVIAAAGLSSRMGAFKPLLPFGEQTAVERVIDAFSGAGVTPIMVVVGYQSQDIEKIVRKHGMAQCTYNPDYPSGMFSSFKHGFRSLPIGIDAVFAHPVDIPLISREIIRQMIRAYQYHPGHVIYPRHKGKTGRPVLIPMDLSDEIITSEEKGGLRIVLNAYLERSRFIESNHPGILWDMDVMEDYRRLQAFYKKFPQ